MNVLNPSRILKKREKFFCVWMSDWTGSLQILCVKQHQNYPCDPPEIVLRCLFRSLLNHDYENCLITEGSGGVA